MTLGIGCHCRTERGSGQGYTCHYFGDPDDCEAYQEDGKQFYLDIVQHIAGIMMCRCVFEKITIGFPIHMCECPNLFQYTLAIVIQHNFDTWS